MQISELHLPAAGFDQHDLPASAAALGLGVGDLEQALRFILSLIASLGGPRELAATVLPGDIHEGLAPDLLEGAGTFADPWRLSWPGAATEEGPDLELWLEPAG